MKSTDEPALRWLGPRKLCVGALLLLLGMPVAQAQNAAALKARHAALSTALTQNAFGRPLHLQSSEQADHLQGDVYAVVSQPYAIVGPTLGKLENWCDILILHLNVKACRASGAAGDTKLRINIGRKSDQPLEDTHQLDFVSSVMSSSTDYLQVGMRADQGPLGTSAYRMMLEVVALDANTSFLHLSYAYRSSTSARVATRGYLSTIGRAKQGFSVVGKKADGSPEYIGGMRGVIERNTMRYYLAIEAYLGALRTPAPQQIEKRLNDWFTGIERYPQQLHELERGEYLAMKHREIARLKQVQ